MKNEAIKSALAVNNCLSKEYLKSKSFAECMAFAHPIDREDIKREIEKRQRGAFRW